jgi:hypothetical protein
LKKEVLPGGKKTAESYELVCHVKKTFLHRCKNLTDLGVNSPSVIQRLYICPTNN